MYEQGVVFCWPFSALDYAVASVTLDPLDPPGTRISAASSVVFVVRHASKSRLSDTVVRTCLAIFPARMHRPKTSRNSLQNLASAVICRLTDHRTNLPSRRWKQVDLKSVPTQLPPRRSRAPETALTDRPKFVLRVELVAADEKKHPAIGPPFNRPRNKAWQEHKA